MPFQFHQLADTRNAVSHKVPKQLKPLSVHHNKTQGSNKAPKTIPRQQSGNRKSSTNGEESKIVLPDVALPNTKRTQKNSQKTAKNTASTAKKGKQI